MVTAARLILLLWALSSYSKSKQILIHYFGETYYEPLSAILPTSYMQFYCTFSFLFFNIGVSLGRRSLIGGVILAIPTSTTIYFNAPRILPKLQDIILLNINSNLDQAFPTLFINHKSSCNELFSRPNLLLAVLFECFYCLISN